MSTTQPREDLAADDPKGESPITPESLVQNAMEAAFNGLPIGMSGTQSARAAARVATVAIRQPRAVVSHTARLVWEQAKVAVGQSDIQPDRRDRRFADEWFTKNPIFKRSMQNYLAWHREVYALLDDLDLDDKSKERAKFLLGLLTETVAPTNSLLGNPTALKKAWRTRGRSVTHGLKHMAYDIRNNGGLPSMVDTRPFVLGDTIAATPGSVVYRNEVMEVIQYAPQTDKVRERPLVIIPPQINRFYILDLSPGRSVVEHAVRSGQQVFMISWRNPAKEQRDWNLDTYVSAISDAIDAAREITGSADVNLTGVCAGGITQASLLGHLAAKGDSRVNSATFMVTVLDWHKATSTMGTFMSGPMITAAVQRSQRRGFISGQDLNGLFAWLRPNDLIWNYWINNYLLGQNPPEFDVLAWNVDSTNLPAGLHADFMQIAKDNLMTVDGGVEVLGTPINLAKVDIDTFVIGAVNDHLTPWQGCYETTNLLGGHSEFVLSNAGHIVAMVNPPGNPKSTYFTNPDGQGLSAEDWFAGATQVSGTWWDRWVEWLAERAGAEVDAPQSLGSTASPAILPAPGTYVRT